jgi:exodeoxyribonuclease VII small subunit
MATQAKSQPNEMNFETAMERLESIVEEMEEGKLMLDDLITRYEEGMKLVGVCQARLASAEKRIEIITRDHAGKPVLKNFDPAAETPRTIVEGKEENEKNDVSLF